MDDYNKLSFKNLILRFVKNSSIYGTFIFLTRFGAFFITPIYWHYLSPKDYGIIGLTAVLQGVLSPIIILGLHGAAERFYYDWEKDEIPKKLGTLWVISILVALFFVALIELTSSHIFPVLFKQVPYNPYFRIVLLTTFFASFQFFPFSILRITEKAKFFGLTSFISFITGAGISITLLAVMDIKVMAVLIGALANSAIWAVFWMVWMLRRSKISLRVFDVKAELYYSLPSLPINIVNTIGNNFDRYLLEKYLGLTQLGYYNLGKSFGGYYNSVNQSFKTAWFPMTYKMFAQRKDMKEILPHMSLTYFYILTIFALSASLLSKEIIYWFGKSKFIEVYQYVPLFILYHLIQNFATAWGRGADLVKKPIYNLISIISSVLVGIVFLYCLVPLYGAYGALGALLISCFVRTSIFVSIAHMLYPRRFLFKEVIYLCVLLISSFYIGYQIDCENTVLSFLFKCIIISFYIMSGSFVAFGYSRIVRQLNKFRLRFVNNRSAAN